MANERINNGPVLTTFAARILNQFRQTVGPSREHLFAQQLSEREARFKSN